MSKNFQDLIKELLSEKGIDNYIELEGTSEGGYLPGGVLECSGTIVDSRGKMYSYWLCWDPQKTAPDGTKGYYTLGETWVNPQTGKPYPLLRGIAPDEEEYKRLRKRLAYKEAKKQLGF